MKIDPKQRDLQWIRKIKKGDTDSFRQLVGAYKDVSLSLAVSILKDSMVAEDVLQEVFLKVYHKLNSFDHRASFSTWLYRIVVNTSYNELKRQKPYIPIETIEETLKISSERKYNMSEIDQKKYINLALEKLRPDETLVLRLFYLCEFSIKEIEAITDFGSSKIKTDLSRGRENVHFQLKRLLGNDLRYLL